jgi:signal transduction histidine kinase
MRRLLPDTMVGQAILVLLVGLIVSHTVSMAIYSGERDRSLVKLAERVMAQRIVNIAHLVSEVPPDWRQRLVQGLNEPGFLVLLDPKRSLVPEQQPAGELWQTMEIQKYIQSLLPPGSLWLVRVNLLHTPYGQVAPNYSMISAHLRATLRGMSFDHRILVSIRLADGTLLDFDGTIPELSSLWSDEAALSMLLMAAAIIFFTAWVERWLTRPLRTLVYAAERLGRDVASPPLDEAGPREVRQAAHAFNGMQKRLHRLIENRTRMLAAISHDLRTPITLLRLRAELIDGVEDRWKTLTILDEMENMIAATLAFARDDAETEECKVVDLVALIDAVCADLADIGGNVTWFGPDHLPYRCAPVALRRALANLVENALKYGKQAVVRLAADGGHVIVTIDDEGSGIPEDRLEDVFSPFVRGEESRNAETGGFGLGLSIAQSVVHAHGGEIRLENRPEGGLRAKIVLPQ